MLFKCDLCYVDSGGNVIRLPILRVGHVCAACFMEFNWAFRLLWLRCFKPKKHQFVGQVNAVFSDRDSCLFRVRPAPRGDLRICPNARCVRGRNCPDAHSMVELEYWRAVKQGGSMCAFTNDHCHM